MRVDTVPGPDRALMVAKKKRDSMPLDKSNETDAEFRLLRAELKVSNEHIRAFLKAAVDAIITIDTNGSIKSFNEAAENMFGYSLPEAIGQNVTLLMGEPHRGRHDEYMKRYLESGEARVIGQLRDFNARRKDGSEFPVQISVSEVDHLGIYIGIVRDGTQQQTLREEIVRVATFEQRRIARELHDSTQQELTGLGLLAQNLVEQLDDANLASEKALALKIASGIAESNRHLRRVTQGLVPVPVQADELMAALTSLAHNAETDYGIQCKLVYPGHLNVSDDNAAVQVYYIVREAVTNAIKHSGADKIAIQLSHRDHTVTVKVRDNGIGIAEDRTEPDGLGLRIMAHRCEILGGTFSVRRRKSGGTIVTCRAPIALSG